MHISSNEIPSQNQLAIYGVTHKLIYVLKLFNFINVGQYLLSYSLNFICGTITTFILQQGVPLRFAGVIAAVITYNGKLNASRLEFTFDVHY